MGCKDRKHKFRPRYDEEYSSLTEENLKLLAKTGGKISNSASPLMCERSLKRKTYIYDICIKCGKIIKRD